MKARLNTAFSQETTIVVYFDQRLGAAQTGRWTKYRFGLGSFKSSFFLCFNSFSSLKLIDTQTLVGPIFEIKTLNEVFIHRKNLCILPFYLFIFFYLKNVNKPYFDQHLEWAAPKHWSKYATFQAWFKTTILKHMQHLMSNTLSSLE